MKNMFRGHKIQAFFLVALISSSKAFAVPPYLGISVGEKLSFKKQDCLIATKRILKNNGFERMEQYLGSATVFAAYRNSNPYHYKVLVKCLVNSGVFIVTVAANTSRQAQQKANDLRYQIQQRKGITRAQVQAKNCSPDKKKEDNKRLKLFSLTKKKKIVSTTQKNQKQSEAQGDTNNSYETTVGETYTLHCRGACLQHAEISLRQSGFYHDYDFDDDTVFGRNNNNYNASIQCIVSESRVVFQVSGKRSRIRDKLLEKLYKNF